jgi:hypothetical protein
VPVSIALASVVPPRAGLRNTIANVDVIFEWQRFWCPRDKTISLSDGGFLYDPESKYGKYQNPDLVTFERLNEVSCLALLGGPGIGKSWTLEAAKAGVDRAL